MKCLYKYPWVKLPRAHIPLGKGVMGSYLKLVSRAAFRGGEAKYCGYTNRVEAGMWSGGIVGLKSILGMKSRTKALESMNRLEELGFISYELNETTKKLTYRISDWLSDYSGAPDEHGAVYATEGYGFVCIPRNITQRLVNCNHVFGEIDAWLDLWCHTVWHEQKNAFSKLAPIVQYGQGRSVLTLETLGARWRWEKTKVWRFFRKHNRTFHLYKLPGSFGCLLYNTLYPTSCGPVPAPQEERILEVLHRLQALGEKQNPRGRDNKRLNCLVYWFSSSIPIRNFNESLPEDGHFGLSRVAVWKRYNTRAYFSPQRYCIVAFDCLGIDSIIFRQRIRSIWGPGKLPAPFLVKEDSS